MYVTNRNVESQINLETLLPCAKERQVTRRIKSGENLFFEGDTATRIYMVVSGVVRLSRLTAGGDRQVISFGYPGDIVGFSSHGVHITDCTALNSAKVIAYRIEELEQSNGNPDLHERLLQAALNEIGQMQEHFLTLGQKSAGEKIASFLSDVADRLGEPLGQFIQFQLPMCRTDIADFLGLTTETVSRCLSQLRKDQVIAVENIHTVIVLDHDALLDLAEYQD